jgi:hypothetical protein
VTSSNSHITENVGAYAIYGGNPAKYLGSRFDIRTIERLLNLAWWDWTDEKINANLELLCSPDIEKFLDSVEELSL